MLITNTFTGKMLKQYIIDQCDEHLKIFGLDEEGIQDDEIYVLHPYNGHSELTISKVSHVDNLDDLRKKYPPFGGKMK